MQNVVFKTVTSYDLQGNAHIVPVQELNWRPAAYGIVIYNNQILLIRHGNGYHLPGGGVEKAEHPRDAVVRELQEEAGIVVTQPKFIDTITTFFTHTSIDILQQLAHVQSLLLYYRCTTTEIALSSAGMQPDEHAANFMPEWVDISKLPSIKVASTVDWRSVVDKCC